VTYAKEDKQQAETFVQKVAESKVKKKKEKKRKPDFISLLLKLPRNIPGAALLCAVKW